jgi:hypothetical protein
MRQKPSGASTAEQDCLEFSQFVFDILASLRVSGYHRAQQPREYPFTGNQGVDLVVFTLTSLAAACGRLDAGVDLSPLQFPFQTINAE